MHVIKSEPLKTVNQFEILNSIRIGGAISRVELSNITGQSRATVTNITARLIKQNLIYEKVGKDRADKDKAARGRKRVLLSINPEAAYVIGVKVSASKIGVVLTNMNADIKSSIIMPVRANERPIDFVADLIEEGIRYCVNEERLSFDQVSGIGVGLPGFVESRKGICHWSPLFKAGDTQLRELIQKRFNIETFVENDTNTVTLAHLWDGQGKGVDNFIVITLEDGVGMGIVVDGAIYRGTKGFAGEFGHMVIDDNGFVCRCGKTGCIEAYASNFAIVSSARNAILNSDWQHVDKEDLIYEDVLAAAKNGIPAVKEVFARAGNALGKGLAILIQTFNPSKIIITGNGVRAGDLMFGPMQETINQKTNDMLQRCTELVIHPWQDSDWALGAACLALQEIYKSPVDRADSAARNMEAMEEKKR